MLYVNYISVKMRERKKKEGKKKEEGRERGREGIRGREGGREMWMRPRASKVTAVTTKNALLSRSHRGNGPPTYLVLGHCTAASEGSCSQDQSLIITIPPIPRAKLAMLIHGSVFLTQRTLF